MWVLGTNLRTSLKAENIPYQGAIIFPAPPVEMPELLASLDQEESELK